MKWAWGVAHAQGFEDEVLRMLEASQSETLITLGSRYQPHRHCFSIYVKSIAENPMVWGLRLGDIAHNYRSCLDHIAWALVHRGTKAGKLTDKQLKNIYFPIVSHSGKTFQGERGRKIPGLRRTDLTLVRSLQPYRSAPTRRHLNCFAVLADLNNKDKHRQIQPLLSLPTGAVITPIGMENCEITRIPTRARSELLKPGAEVQRVFVRKTGMGEPHLGVKGGFTFEIALYEDLAFAEWFAVTTGKLFEVLDSLSDNSPPDQIGTIPVDWQRLGDALDAHRERRLHGSPQGEGGTA